MHADGSCHHLRPCFSTMRFSYYSAHSLTGGVWSTVTGHAAVSGGGIVTGLSGGVDTVLYTLTNSCYFTATRYPVTVNPLPVAGPITGLAYICVEDIDTLSAPPGGTWNSSNPSIASVDAFGHAVAIAPGVDTITYTVTNSCGTISATFVLTILAPPVLAPITGPSALCIATFITLTDTTTGGTWSAANATATVAAGIVTGVGPGPNTISYSKTNFCGTVTATHPVTIDVMPTVSAIVGLSTVCKDSTIILTNATVGGVWSSVSSSIATIGTSGRITGHLPGFDTIKYTVTNSCGSASGYTIIHVLDCVTGVTPLYSFPASIIISPNPSDGIFNIQLLCSANNDAEIIITNIAGEQVKHFTMSPNKNKQIQLNVPAGIYTVTATLNNERLTQKLIVR
jgi:hypothetical protein